MGGNSSKNKNACFDDDAEVTFDHFQILRAIGKGSFGKVCIVQKKDSNQMYAMKYMNKSQCVEKDAVRNVLREIEILALLEHPFLVNLWFSFQDAEDMFMVVDLLLGGDLRYHIQQSGRFDEQRVRFYICELALALQYLQEQHILHRDIKPDNILLDEEGHVHITDFNIATVLQDGQLATSMTGTKPYMAPEVFACALDECPGYSYAVDWWSLGVCAYEMLRSKRPFDIHSGTSISEVRQMFTLYTVHFSSSWPNGLRDLLRKLLCVKPAKRISQLSELSKHPYVADMDFDQLLQRKITPHFVPAKDHLNCDPTFELEEMIIEAKPLHKKKKRLSKQNSKREQQGSSHRLDIDPIQVRVEEIEDEFRVYNRPKELELRERERKEREWQEELELHMNSADPHANYRKDLKLPLVSALRLSPALSRSIFGRRSSANRSPSKSPEPSTDNDGLVIPTSAIRRDSSSPLKWIDSPRRDRPTLKPFQSIDVGIDSDSDSGSEDKSKDSLNGKTGKQIHSLPDVTEMAALETSHEQSDVQDMHADIILCTEPKMADSPSNNNNALHQCNNASRSPRMWAHSSNRNSSSQSHDSCDSDAPPYFPRNDLSKQDSFLDGVAIKRQDSGTTDSMVSCCTSFSYQGIPPKESTSPPAHDEISIINVQSIH